MKIITVDDLVMQSTMTSEAIAFTHLFHFDTSCNPISHIDLCHERPDWQAIMIVSSMGVK